jgi:hypothetical protein
MGNPPRPASEYIYRDLVFFSSFMITELIPEISRAYVFERPLLCFLTVMYMLLSFDYCILCFFHDHSFFHFPVFIRLNLSSPPMMDRWIPHELYLTITCMSYGPDVEYHGQSELKCKIVGQPYLAYVLCAVQAYPRIKDVNVSGMCSVRRSGLSPH